MSKLKERLENIKKPDEILITALSISLSFTVLFFTSAELFVRNQIDFTVDGWHIILPMLLLALMVSAAEILLLNLLLLIHDALFIIISRLMAGLLLAVYAQELFLNGEMTSITGTDSMIMVDKWLEYTDNIILYLLILLPLILHFCGEKFPNVKFFHIGKDYAIPYLAGLIFVMQAVGLTSSIAQFGFNRYERINYAFLSFEPIVSLSKENNIVVFLTDRLDSTYMDAMLESHPEVYDELDGFTFYQNNLSNFATTFPSVLNMLTGVEFEGEEGIDYYKKAWSGRMFADELKENNYHINLLLDNVTTYNRFNEIESRCDNLVQLEKDEYSINYLGKNGIVHTMLRLSAARVAPYSFKPHILWGTETDFSTEFIYPHNTAELLPKAIGISSDLMIHDYITSHPLTDDNAQKTFSFIHLNCAHDPSDDLMHLYDCEHEPRQYSVIDTARGDFEIIFEYIRQMKRLGIYDNSTIIVVGDHGRPLSEINSSRSEVLESPIVTTLLIKEAGESGSLKLDSTTELHNNYLAASIMEYAGLDHSDYGYSYNDIIAGDPHFDRYFTALIKGRLDNGKLYFLTYKVTGNARDFDNWEIIN